MTEKNTTIFLAFPFGDSAVSNHFSALAESLNQRGYEVVILSPPPKSKKDSMHERFIIERWPSKRPTKWQDFFFYLRMLKIHRPVLVLGNFAATNIVILGGWLFGTSNRITYYHTASDYHFMHGLTKWVQLFKKKRKSLIYKLCTQIITVSKATKEDIIQNFNVSGDKVEVYQNALRDPQIPIKPIHERSNDLICVARLVFGKGQDILIHAMARLVTIMPDVKLKFLGSGEALNSLTELVHDLDLGNNIEFLGNVPHNEVLERIADSKILILPTRFEATPYVIIEALSTGTPIIASNVGGIPEMINEGVEGSLVPSEDPEELFRAILRMFSNPQKMETISHMARNRFLKSFELVDLINRQSVYIENLINRQ